MISQRPPESHILEYMWYSIAISRDAEDARAWRDGLVATMTPDAIARAEALTQACVRKKYKDCETF